MNDDYDGGISNTGAKGIEEANKTKVKGPTVKTRANRTT